MLIDSDGAVRIRSLQSAQLLRRAAQYYLDHHAGTITMPDEDDLALLIDDLDALIRAWDDRDNWQDYRQ